MKDIKATSDIQIKEAKVTGRILFLMRVNKRLVLTVIYLN